MIVRSQNKFLIKSAAFIIRYSFGIYLYVLTDIIVEYLDIDFGTKILKDEILRNFSFHSRKSKIKNKILINPEKRIMNENSSNKIKILFEIFDELNNIDIKGFISFGTLLGYVRENSLLDDDNDIDIGILKSDTNYCKVKNHLLSVGYKLIECYDSDISSKIKIKKNKTEVPVDIHFFLEKDGYLFTSMILLGHHIVRKRKYFNLNQVDFENHKIWIPKDPEIFLEENYGNWKQKAEYYHFLISSELTDFRLPIVEYFLAKEFYINFKIINEKAINSILDIALNKFYDLCFWEKISELRQL